MALAVGRDDVRNTGSLFTRGEPRPPSGVRMAMTRSRLRHRASGVRGRVDCARISGQRRVRASRGTACMRCAMRPAAGGDGIKNGDRTFLDHAALYRR